MSQESTIPSTENKRQLIQTLKTIIFIGGKNPKHLKQKDSIHKYFKQVDSKSSFIRDSIPKHLKSKKIRGNIPKHF